MDFNDKQKYQVQEMEIENRILKDNIKALIDYSDMVEQIKKENDELRKELDSIKYSRSYKLIQKLKKIMWWRN